MLVETLAPWGLGVTLLIACGPGLPADESTTTASTTTPPTSSATSPTTTCGPNEDCSPDAEGGPPDLAVGPACDVFARDCPADQKCVAWSSDGSGLLNASRCVPVTGDQRPGEPCRTTPGPPTGLDDCHAGATCWDADDLGVGTCVALCTGTAERPICAAGFTCLQNSEALNLCLPTCDPLQQDCPDDDLCLPGETGYLCVLDASGADGAVFDPCAWANGCDPGLLCYPPGSAVECDPDAVGCCVPMCSLAGDPPPCPGAGQSCVPIFAPPPAGFADVGVCALLP